MHLLTPEGIFVSGWWLLVSWRDVGVGTAAPTHDASSLGASVSRCKPALACCVERSAICSGESWVGAKDVLLLCGHYVRFCVCSCATLISEELWKQLGHSPKREAKV